ncbi:HAD-IB family phosphatase [Opitutaceae bacterium]|nr:HAD-IB family phosphatase [Opitutaceae bacterium]
MSDELKLVIFDCDSTLSAIEGVDELARVRGPELFAEVEAMTHAAMDGKIPVQAVFGQRLDIIRPTQADVAAVGQRYIDEIEPTVEELLPKLRGLGWTPVILSGGFRQAIAPLAKHLGIKLIEAVDLIFDAEGNYVDYDREYPTTRSGGKPEVITALGQELNPTRVVMVGDGVSDLETQPMVDLFVGFGRYVRRAKVESEAARFITRLDELESILGL